MTIGGRVNTQASRVCSQQITFNWVSKPRYEKYRASWVHKVKGNHSSDNVIQLQDHFALAPFNVTMLIHQRIRYTNLDCPSVDLLRPFSNPQAITR